MKRFFAAFGFFAALLTMVSCEKDTNPNFIRASISNYHGPDKVYIGANNYACWDGSENIWINGVNTYTLTTIVGDNSRFLIDMGDNQPEAGDILYALFQSDDMTLDDFNTTTVETTDETTHETTSVTTATIPVTLPREQIYAEDQQGRQVINAPMVAQATVNAQGGADLKFHNVCSLLKIQLRPKVFVHDITVTSSAAPLAGSGTVTFSETNPTLVMNSTAAGDKVVKLTVNKSRSDGVFYIVLPPYSTPTKLTVEVYDDPQVRMKLQQQANHTLGASEIATIDVGSGDEGRGIFSVSANSKVSFAKGNLKGSGTNLDFEDEQMDNGDGYGQGNRPSISGQMAQEWFYLSQTEWNYLLSRNYGGHIFAIRGSITDDNNNTTYQGLILLPDTWYDNLIDYLPEDIQNQFDNSTPNLSGLAVTYWNICEALGAVFIPAYTNSHATYFTGTPGIFIQFGNQQNADNQVQVVSHVQGSTNAHVRLAHFVVGSPQVPNTTN